MTAGEALRVCLLTREYPGTSAPGGIGTYTRTLAQALVRRGHEVTLLRPPGSLPPGDGLVHVAVDAPPRWRLPAGNAHLGLTLGVAPFMRAAGQAFAELDAARPFDVVEVPEYQGCGLGIAKRARGRLVVRLHGHAALVRRLDGVTGPGLDGVLVSRLEGAAIARATRVMANSAALAAAATADFGLAPGRAEVLPLGIDAAVFKPGPRGALHQRLGLPLDTPILLFVGRLEQRKGLATLLQAFAALDVPLAPVLVIAGGPPPGLAVDAMQAWQDRARALGLGDRVRWLGPVPAPELPLLYAGCDLFVAPSPFEPFGLVYLEAMACARPVVACNTGGVPEVVRDGATGRLVPPEDAAALAGALTDLLVNPVTRAAFGVTARTEVLERFSTERLAERTEALYREIAGAPTGSGVLVRRPG